MELVGGVYVANTNSMIALDESFNIVVKPTTISENTVYIQASFEGVVNPVYLQILISINCLGEMLTIGTSLTESYQ